jgi:7-carboxy-7-deazaguanine synthase
MAATVRVSSDGVFYTVQGEGPLVGVPSLFVRLDACNLKCRWGETVCDAYYTSWAPQGQAVALEELTRQMAAQVAAHAVRHLVITGGEPALQPRAVCALAAAFKAQVPAGHVTIETNGTLRVPGAAEVLDLVCLSPKLSSSVPTGTKWEKVHARNRLRPEVLRWWRELGVPYYFKIVIDAPADVAEAVALLEQVGQALEPEHVLFMPQGIASDVLWERGRWVAAECKRLGVRFTPRIQIDLWGNTPGT